MLGILVGSWNQGREPIKRRWNKLTDDDLDSIDCNYDFLAGLLQKKYGYSALTPPKTKSNNTWPKTHGDISH